MIVWQRLGILGFLIPAILYNVFNWAANRIHGAGYTQTHNGPAIAAVLFSAVLVGVLGLWVEHESRRITVPTNGWQRIAHGRHTLFFIPLKYFALVLVVIAVFMTIAKPTL